jgi:CheY-like chemotaxis protein
LSEHSKRTILALLNDLFLLPRIQDVAQRNGYSVEFVTQAENLGMEGDPRERVIPLTEPLDGPEAILVRQISASQPGLILIDAGMTTLPWASWIRVLKTSSATRRIPILVFAPHVQAELLERARSAGADAVVTRGSFNNRMTELIDKHCLKDRTHELITACHGELAHKAIQGIELHNQGEFLEAHEFFEQAWMGSSELEGYLYRTLLQFTVAHLHYSRGNIRGAQKMLLRIHQWLDPLPDACRGVDLAMLKLDVSTLRDALTTDPLSVNLRRSRIQLLS